MTSRWKKVWADFWGNKGRTFLTIMTIAVGVLAVGFNSNMGLYMNESMDRDFLSANPSEATIYTSDLTDDLIEIARSMPGVDAAEGRSTTSAMLQRETGDPIFIMFTAAEDPSALTLNTLKPAPDETTLPTLGDKQIIMDAAAASLGFMPGDQLTIEINGGRENGGRDRVLTFAGYVHDVAGFPYNLTNQINAYVTPDTMEWLGGSRAYNVLAISVTEKQTDQDHVTEIAQAVADRLERAGVTIHFVSVYQPGHHFAWGVSQGVFFVLSTLGYLTVLLSSLLIVNTVTALMTQQTRQIGIMKAVGGGTAQVFLMYIALILTFGAAALVIAVPLANMAGQSVGAGMAAWLNFYPAPYRGYTATLVQQIIVALVVPLIAALWPIYNSVRVTVREAISDYGIGGNNKPPKKTSVGRSAVLMPRPMRLSLRNAFRRKARLALTLFTMVMAGAIFIGVYNLWASFDRVMQDIAGYFLADINIGFSRNYRYDEVASIAETVPGVTSVEGWIEYTGTLLPGGDQAGTQIVFVAPPSTSTLIDPIITGGRWLMIGDENAVVVGNHLLAMFPELKIGDWLTIEIDGRETKWRIVGFYSLTGNVSPPLLYVNYEYLSKLIGAPGQVYSLRVITDRHDSTSQHEINDRLRAAYEARGIQLGPSSMSADFIRDQKAQTDILVYFMLVMATLIAIVGGLGLMGTMSINVLERTREIGVMRAIGASNGDIQGIVIAEGMMIGLISWAVSILLAIPITKVLTAGVGLAIFTAPLPVVFGVTGVVAWLTFTLALAIVASALPARRASRLTVRDTLAYE